MIKWQGKNTVYITGDDKKDAIIVIGGIALIVLLIAKFVFRSM